MEAIFSSSSQAWLTTRHVLVGQNLPKEEALVILEIIEFHFMSGVINLIKWWVINDMPYSVEDMAEYINATIVHPFWHLHKLEVEHKNQKDEEA